MGKQYALLPCNGIDKCAGCISREIALNFADKTNSSILCPIFYRISDTKYNEILKEKELIVIDGCNTKCASKLAIEKNLNISKKINISQEAKEVEILINNDKLKLEEDGIKLVDIIVEKLLSEDKDASRDENSSSEFNISFNYETYKKDKFIFRLPMNDNLYFIENDCWAHIERNIATIGITDFAQQSLGDIMFFEPPKLDSYIAQFDEVGCLESSKATLEIVSPVSGKVIAINAKLDEYPEYINDNPYEKGWLVKIELSDFEEDKELLIKDKDYFEILKGKVDNFHV